MTNKKENKILRKAMSLSLAVLVSILGIPLAKPQQVSAAETSDPKFLSSITIEATSTSTWADEGKYDADLYATLTGNDYSSSYKTEQTALEIKTPAELAAFAKAVNVDGKTFEGKYVKLTAPIDLGGTNPDINETTSGNNFSISITGSASNVWVPIGNSTTHFKGNFDGGNFEISNMTVLENSTSGTVRAGLFGYVDSGSIKNTGVTGDVYASSSSDVYAGGLVGSIYGSDSSISNSYATGDVYASSSSSSSRVYAGGLVGSIYGSDSSSISNSYATGNVYSSSSSSRVYAGGLVGGSGSSSISNSYATGDVYAYSSSSSSSSSASVYAGGLVGYSSSSISNSYATGDVYASSSSSSAAASVYAGGLVGHFYGSSITNSYATGNVSSSSKYVHAGGLVGCSSSSSSISGSRATGNVYASSSSDVYAGGLVGYGDSGSITNSYATGDVYASSSDVYAGGLVGYGRSGSIINSYATGNVYGSSSTFSVRAGGLVGYKGSSVSITNGYYYSGATIDGGTGATISKEGTGLNLEQMTGIGTGRATEKVVTANWEFQEDSDLIRFLPRLRGIEYNEETNPAPRLVGFISSDFDFKAPTNLAYDGSAKEATVTSKISEVTNDKITVKYYKNGVETSPIEPGTYKVKIDVAAGDGYEAQTGISADDWTFTIIKSNPIINSISTSATYASGLTLEKVPYPSTRDNTPGSWSWVNPSSSISAVGTYKFEAKFTPTDSENFNEVTKTILVTIGKADLTISPTSASTTYAPGLTLKSVPYPSSTSGSWSWLTPSTSISNAGKYYFEAKFTPTDSKNFNEVTKSLLVIVNKATPKASDFDFLAPSNLGYTGDYKVATVTPKSGIEGMGTPTVKYFTKINGELMPLQSSSMPMDIGTYYVGVNVSDGVNYESASGLNSDAWTFEIEFAQKHVYRLKDKSLVYIVQQTH